MLNIQMKGASLRSIPQFVNEVYSEHFDEWYKELPDESKIIFGEQILSTKWYDLNIGNIDPIITLGNVFFENNLELASYEIGKYAGKKALEGIYKIFIKIPSIDFILKRVAIITATYFSGGIKLDILKNNEKKILISITGFYLGQELIIPNIAGWMDNLMSIISKKEYKIKYHSTPTNDGKIKGNISIIFSTH